jgi:hypothetical protein
VVRFNCINFLASSHVGVIARIVGDIMFLLGLQFGDFSSKGVTLRARLGQQRHGN